MGASGWLVEAAWPTELPVTSRECVHDLVVSVVLYGFAWRGFERGRGTARMRLAVASACLLGVPAALIEAARGGVSEVTVAQMFALAPVAVVVLAPAFDLGRGYDTMRLLGPAAAGLAGVLLMLSFALPGSWREARLEAMVVLAVLLAAAASVWMYRLLPGFSVVEAVLVCCVANAIFWLLAAAAMAVGGPFARGSRAWESGWTRGTLIAESAKALLFDLPRIVLLLWLMRGVPPVRLAARWLVVPLFTVIEGYVLLRPEVTVRSIAGAVLAGFGAWRLMTADERGEEPRLVLR